MSLPTLLFQSYPTQIFTAVSLPLAAFALHPNSNSTVPFVILLSVLLLYSPILFRRTNGTDSASPHRIAWLWLSLTLGGALPFLSPSLDALSTVGESILAMVIISGVTSSLVVALLYAHTRLFSRFASTWSQLTLFPALWATLSCTLAYISPVGYLGVWTAPYEKTPYSWLISYTGPTALSWIVAAWASLISQAVATWYMGSSRDSQRDLATSLIDHEYTDEDHFIPSTASYLSSSLVLSMLLVVLAIPSVFFASLPLPVISMETTPVGVGCVLPSYQRYKHHTPTLQDYIKETERLQSSAKLLLWPEGAVSFGSEDERTDVFQTIQHHLQKNVHVGVSFEETFMDPVDSTGWTGSKRTGIALISNSSTSPHFVYYKRHLVPIAESFSLRHSSAPPALYTIDLPPPNKMNSPDWAPGPDHTRPISVTASICLDFAQPMPFAALDSRPSVILGPANTWDRTVGYMMWKQAVQRANELETTILWCDGGKGSVSGIAGAGYGEILHVGAGSWVRELGIEYPFRDRRSVYAWIGDAVLLLFWFAVGGVLVTHRVHIPSGRFGQVRALLGRGMLSFRGIGRKPQEHPPNLLEA